MNFREMTSGLIMDDKVWIPALLTGIAFGSMYYFGIQSKEIVATIVGVLGGIIIGKTTNGGIK